MFLDTRFVIVTVLLALLCLICPPPARMQQKETAKSSKVVTITDDNNNGEVNLPQGGTLVVQLTSNPSTGYSWRVAQNDETLLKPLDNKYVRPESKLIGAPGRQVFRFKAAAAGGTELILLYQSATMKGVEAAKKFQVMVTINRAGQTSGAAPSSGPAHPSVGTYTLTQMEDSSEQKLTPVLRRA